MKTLTILRRTLPRTLAALAFASLLTVPVHRTTADDFAIGGAHGSFEAGLIGVATTGNVSSVTHLGTNLPSDGNRGVLLTTEPDAGATSASATVSTLKIENFAIPAGVTALKLDYAFATDEPTPSLTNDRFTAKLVLVTAGGEETLLAVDTFDSFFDAHWTSYAKHTGLRNLVANVAAHAGTGNLVTLELRVEDTGDGRRNSAVFVDAIRFAGADDPIARANFDYKEVAINEVIRFDGTGSTVATPGVTYNWVFGNGFIGNAPIIDLAYAEGGIYTGALTVTDGNGKSATDTFTVVVGGIINRPPEIVSAAVTTAKENGKYSYQVVATDPEVPYGDVLTYSLDAAPAGMTINPATGLISWTPTPANPPVNAVTVRVTDSLGLFDTQGFNVTVDITTFVVATDDNSRAYYARSNGDGTWSNFRWFATMPTSFARGAAIADFDNDGFLDIILPGDPGVVDFYFFKNDGADNFTNVGVIGSTPAAIGHVYGMAVGDFNHDGNWDFVANNESSNLLTFGFGDGRGGFTITQLNTGVGNGRGMSAGDFNNDGYIDIVRGITSSGQVRLHLNDGNGNFPAAGVVVGATSDPYGVVAGDFNEDGNLDYIVNQSSSGDAFLYPGNGNGTFGARIAVPSIDFNNWGKFDAYDFNRDGHLDLVATIHTARILRFYPGNGDGTFGAGVDIATSGNFSHNIMGLAGPPAPPPAQAPKPRIVPNPAIASMGATIDFTGEFSTDDGTITAYNWQFEDGGMASGQQVTHSFPNVEADHWARLKVTDDTNKTAMETARVVLQGEPPIADAGGPYNFGEAFANAGVYTVPLDGTGSSDAEGPVTYFWDSGNGLNETFTGGIDSRLWNPTGNVNVGIGTTGNEAVISRVAGNWDQALLSDKIYDRQHGQSFTGRVRVANAPTNQHWTVFGLKDLSAGLQESAFIHAFYLANGQLQIREKTSNLGTVATYTQPIAYDLRIDVKKQGATYYAKPAGAPTWTFVYDSASHTDAQYRFGVTMWSGTAGLDDLTASSDKSTAQNPSFKYMKEGVYNASLKVTDQVGQTDIDNTTITIAAGPPPVANTGGPYVLTEANAVCNVWTANLNGLGSTDDAAILSYSWNFGDGAMGTGATPSHAYAAGGPYNISLTVTDNALQSHTAFSTVTLTKQALPVANAGPDQAVDESVANAGFWTVNFNGTGSSDDNGICSYSWNWGDGTPAGTGPTPTHLYAAAGVYTVTLTVTDHAGQQHSDQMTVTVTANALPVADVGGAYFADESVANQGNWPITFNATGSTDDFGIWQYDWNFGDGVILPNGGPTPTHNYTNVGNYTVTLTVRDNGRQTHQVQTTAQVVANDPPVPSIVAPAVAGEAYAVGGIWHVPFDATGSTDDFGIWKFEWNFGDGTTGTGAQITHQYTQTGTYVVTLTVTDHAKQAVSLQHIVDVIMNDPPVANAGGPYNANETTATNAVFRPQLNGTGSTDDVAIFDYEWIIGPPEVNANFAGMTLDTGFWTAVGATQNERLTVVGNGSTWGARYAFTANSFPRVLGEEKVFKARLLFQNPTGNQHAMIGLKNSDSNFSYTQMPHAIYFDNGTVRVYQNGSNVASPASYERNVWYDVRITLLEVGGALYQFKRADSQTWIDLFQQYSIATSPLRAGITIHSGTVLVDDIRMGKIVDGPTPRPRIKTPGVYDVLLTVRDNALQVDTDTTTLTVAKGNAPVANAGGPYTIERGMLLALNSTGSSDDFGIEHFEWDFDDGSISTQANPRHFWDQPGVYNVSVTAWDHVGQSHTATTTVNVITGLPPIANAGGPYTAGANGVPAFVDGSASFDDYGIANYKWYIGTNTSGDPVQVGRFAALNFTTAGAQTITLVVEDGAGQTSSAQATVNVSATLPPKVITIPWVGPDPVVPHETWPGKEITFKGVVHSNNATQYQWDFGDGITSPLTAITAANRHALEARHAYDVNIPAGTPFIATLTVFDNLGNQVSATYNVIIKPKSLTTEVNVAIDEGLWYLHKQQVRNTTTTNGMWNFSTDVATTAPSLNSFMANSHQPEGNPATDPYVETVRRGLDYMFTRLTTEAIAANANGNPDVNGNGIGIRVVEGTYPYQGGPVMDAIIASGAPLRRTRTGSTVAGQPPIKGMRYWDIVQEMVESYGWGQQATGGNSSRGGWRYNWQGGNDNSAAQWAAIGLIPAERLWGHKIPAHIKPLNLQFIIGPDQDQNTGQMGYVGTGGVWGDASTTASGMVQMAMDNIHIDDTRWIKASGRMRQKFEIPTGNDSIAQNFYAEFALSKAMRLSQPVRTDLMCQACGPNQEIDWYADPVKGLARNLIDKQILAGADYGGWVQPSGLSGSGSWQKNMASAWAVLILTRELFEVGPVADAGPDRVWGVDIPLAFDGSNSFHPDPFRTIVKYEWDFNGDGVFDSNSPNPTAQHTYSSALYPEPTLPRNFLVTLKVTDDAGRTGVDTATIIVAVPPHPPVADAGGPYTCTLGLPCTLDGSGSFDIDPTDFITMWEWELGGGGVPDFAEASGEIVQRVFNTAGVFNIGLRVWDNGVLNTNNDKLSDQQFTTVTVVENLPPIANPGGPYVVNEGTPVMLDGTGSSDPNGDPISYSWDLDNDGTFETPGTSPMHTFMDNGVYPVTLRVSDSLLSNQASAQVTVNDLSPTAAFAPPAGTEGAPVQFTDASTTPVDPIVSWHWDFAGLGSSNDQNPSFTFPDNGVFPVTLTVTDDDGSVHAVVHNVTIANANPVVEAGANQTVLEGDTVNVNATFTDAGVNDAPWTATIDWGDGTVTAGVVGGTAAAGTVSGSHVYADNGVYTVTVTVTDKNGGAGSDSLTATVNNAPPVVDAGPDRNAFVGQNVAVNATFTDAGTADTHTATIDWGDGTVEPGTVNQGAGSGGVTGNHAYLAAGDYTVTVTVTDDDGGAGAHSFVAHITVPPAGLNVNAGPDQTVTEGSTATLAANFTFDNQEVFTAMIDWGDGTVEPGIVVPDTTTWLVQGSHIYRDNGLYTVIVTVTGGTSGNSANDSLVVTVENAPPVVDAGPNQTVTEGDNVALNASFTDAGVDDTHTATIDWGDGTVEPGTVAQGAGNGTVTGSHVYAVQGVYTVTVSVTDDDGGTGSDTMTVTVESGFVATQTIFDLRAEPKPSKVDLVWTPVAGAESYNVYRSTVAGGPYLLIAQGYTCTYCAYADLNLTNGVTYYYVVTSHDNGHQSLYSNEASATPQALVPRRR